MTAPLTDIELMALLTAGDREALRALVSRHQRPLVNFFRRMGAGTHECEDLTQETFLRLYQYRDRYQPTGKFTNLLFVLARHVWADMARKAIRAPVADEEAVARESVDCALGVADARIDVRQALAGLSEKLRMVLVLNVYEGLSYQEIADMLEVPLGTVKSRMHLAMQHLKERMNDGQ